MRTAAGLVALLLSLSGAQVRAGGLLWQADLGATRLHLLGALHVGVPAMYPLHPAVESAVREAGRLMVEVDLLGLDPAEMAAAVRRHGMLPGTERLGDVLAPSTFQALSRLAGELAVPLGVFERQRPWLVALTLGSLAVLRQGLEERHGVDRHVLGRLRGRVPVIELEGLEAQLRLLAAIPEPEQRELLAATVSGFDEAGVTVREMVAAWRAGDAARMAALIERDTLRGGATAASLRRRLFDERNASMTAGIRAQLSRPGRLLVVVGAGHLVGSGSIVERLRAAAIDVRQVATAAPGPASPSDGEEGAALR